MPSCMGVWEYGGVGVWGSATPTPPYSHTPILPRPLGLAHRLDEDLRHLRPGELHRGHLAGAEHLADLRPGEGDVALAVVGAGLPAGHAFALVAPEAVLELQRDDLDGGGIELLEDRLRVVGAVVAADARVV